MGNLEGGKSKGKGGSGGSAKGNGNGRVIAIWGGMWRG